MRNQQYIIYFFLLLLAGAVYLSLKFSYIGSDAPYYLAVARDISSGLIPYKDIYLSYTPLVMYFNAIVFKIISIFNFSIFLGFQYLIIFAAGFLLYVINKKFVILEKKKALLLSIFFVLAVMSSDGNDVILEIYSALFVLSGLFFFFRGRIFWTGFFLGLSFFCKQFGLLNFIPFFILFYLEKEHTFSKISFISAGAVVPLVLFLLYFAGYADIPLASLFKQLNGAAYVSYSLVSWGSFKTYFIGAKVFVLLLIPFFLYNSILKDRLNIFLVVGILINLLPLMLQSFQHYYINTFPFLFVLIGRVWKHNKNRIIVYYSLSTFLISALFYLRVFRYSDRNEVQELIGQHTTKILPANSKVFLNGDIRYLYLMNNYKNPVVSEKGYSYPYKPDEKARDTINVLSGTEFPENPSEMVKVKDRYLYLYTGSEDEIQ